MWYIYVDNLIQVGLYPIRLPDLDLIGFLLTILSETTKGRYSTQKNTLLANQTDIGSVSTSESTTRDSTSQAMDIQTSTSPGKGYRAYLWQHIFHKWAIKQTVYAFRRSSLMQFKFLYIWFVLVLWSHLFWVTLTEQTIVLFPKFFDSFHLGLKVFVCITCVQKELFYNKSLYEAGRCKNVLHFFKFCFM